MKVTQIKVLAWLTAFGLTLGLCTFVWDFISTLPERQRRPTDQEMRQALQPEEGEAARADERISYTAVEATFHSFDWSGAPPPPPRVSTPTSAGPAKPPRTPVADLLSILMIQEDVGDPSGSSIYIRYKPKAAVRDPQPADEHLRLEERLLPPHDGVRIVGISATDGVTFGFDEEGREPETLSPREFDATTEIVKVGPEGERVPVRPSLIRSGPPGQAFVAPRRTHTLAPNRFRVGTEDAAYFGENYIDVLSRDVRTARYQNPRTGKYEGVEIKSVKPGSMAARHGAQEGDIVKSINGHPVSSVQEAITFAKNNADVYDVWEIEVENKGKVRTVVYETPKD